MGPFDGHFDDMLTGRYLAFHPFLDIKDINTHVSMELSIGSGNRRRETKLSAV